MLCQGLRVLYVCCCCCCCCYVFALSLVLTPATKQTVPHSPSLAAPPSLVLSSHTCVVACMAFFRCRSVGRSVAVLSRLLCPLCGRPLILCMPTVQLLQNSNCDMIPGFFTYACFAVPGFLSAGVLSLEAMKTGAFLMRAIMCIISGLLICTFSLQVVSTGSGRGAPSSGYPSGLPTAASACERNRASAPTHQRI